MREGKRHQCLNCLDAEVKAECYAQLSDPSSVEIKGGTMFTNGVFATRRQAETLDRNTAMTKSKMDMKDGLKKTQTDMLSTDCRVAGMHVVGFSSEDVDATSTAPKSMFASFCL